MKSGSNLVLRAVPLVIYLLAAGLLVVGKNNPALAFLLIGILASVTLEVLNHRASSSTLPTLSTEQRSQLRSDRQQFGEVSAVKKLRTDHPEFSLTDATHFIRSL